MYTLKIYRVKINLAIRLLCSIREWICLYAINACVLIFITHTSWPIEYGKLRFPRKLKLSVIALYGSWDVLCLHLTAYPMPFLLMAQPSDQVQDRTVENHVRAILYVYTRAASLNSININFRAFVFTVCT